MKRIGKKKVNNEVWFEGEKHTIISNEDFVQASMGELLHIYFELQRKPFWKRDFETKFAIEQIEEIMGNTYFEFPHRQIRHIPKELFTLLP